jgi:hypothetical protein
MLEGAPEVFHEAFFHSVEMTGAGQVADQVLDTLRWAELTSQ